MTKRKKSKNPILTIPVKDDEPKRPRGVLEGGITLDKEMNEFLQSGYDQEPKKDR